MTAPRRRTPRPARAARPRRADPRTAIVPSAPVRRRRGPRPPDHVVALLVAALPPVTRQDAAGDPSPLGPRWRSAIDRALAAITRAARRGVQGALGTPATPVPDPAPPENWGSALTSAVKRALQSSLEAATQAISEMVFGEHTRQVASIATAMGAADYIWTTMHDDRVRPLHVKLEGTRQRWDAPPLAGLPSFHGHPGEAAGPCRCQAWPIR